MLIASSEIDWNQSVASNVLYVLETSCSANTEVAVAVDGAVKVFVISGPNQNQDFYSGVSLFHWRGWHPQP